MNTLLLPSAASSITENKQASDELKTESQVAATTQVSQPQAPSKKHHGVFVS